MKQIELDFSFHIKNLIAESKDPPRHSLTVETHSMARSPVQKMTVTESTNPTTLEMKDETQGAPPAFPRLCCLHAT